MKTTLGAIMVLPLLGTALSCGETLSPECVLPSEETAFSLSGTQYACPTLDEVRITPGGISVTTYSLLVSFTSDSTFSLGYSFTVDRGNGKIEYGSTGTISEGRYSLSGRSISFGRIEVPDVKSSPKYAPKPPEGRSPDKEPSFLVYGTLKGEECRKMECLLEIPSLTPGEYLLMDFSLTP